MPEKSNRWGKRHIRHNTLRFIIFVGNVTGWNVMDIEASQSGADGNATAAYYAAGFVAYV